jgi:hypothetical protein
MPWFGATLRTRGVRGARMKGQFFRDHFIGFEVVAALAIGALLRFGFDAGWVLAILSGLSVFVLMPLLILLVVHFTTMRAAK